jgi:hypothetical protein
MRTVWRVVLAAVVLAAVVVLGFALLSPGDEVSGTGRGERVDKEKQELLTRCGNWDGENLATLRYGPVLKLDDTILGYLVIAATPERKLLSCGASGDAQFSVGPPQPGEGREVFFGTAGPNTIESTGFHGFGWASRDVARVEVVADDRTIRAELANGIFAYAGKGRAPRIDTLRVRGYDASGTLLDEQGFQTG